MGTVPCGAANLVRRAALQRHRTCKELSPSRPLPVCGPTACGTVAQSPTGSRGIQSAPCWVAAPATRTPRGSAGWLRRQQCASRPPHAGRVKKGPAKALQNRPCSPWFHASGGALRGRAGGENRPAPRPTHVARAWPPRLGHGMACAGLPAVCAPKTRDRRRNGSLDLASAPQIKFWPAARRNLVPLMLRRRHQSRLARRPLSAT